MVRTANAEWNGDLKTGKGVMSSASGVLSSTPFSFHTRFEDAPGTNPEELVGAAHAGCFSMAFSHMLSSAGFVPTSVQTTAEVTFEPVDGAPTVTKIHLVCNASVPGISADDFQKIAADAKAGCPISRLLKAEITLDATLA